MTNKILKSVRKAIQFKHIHRKIFQVFPTCDRIGLTDVTTSSAEYSNPVPLILVCDVVVNPHEFRPVFWYEDVSLTSVTSEILRVSHHISLKLNTVKPLNTAHSPPGLGPS